MKIIAIIPATDEEGKIGKVIRRVPGDIASEILVVDDGSVDATAQESADNGANVVSNPKREGVGKSIRRGFDYALEKNYDIVVIIAGNNKDCPEEIKRLVGPIETGDMDFVQGSRYLNSGRYGQMPLYRIVATKYVHPLLLSLLVHRRITDSTNGFRALRTSLLKDPHLNLRQEWLNGYEMEPYLFYKAMKLGYRVEEIPVTKIYPPRKIGYTKMRPIVGWWSILRPLMFLALGIKR